MEIWGGKACHKVWSTERFHQMWVSCFRFPELVFVTRVRVCNLWWERMGVDGGRWWGGEFNVWVSGTWSERAGLLSGGNKYCRHQWEMLHLFNVPFPKWNPCNPTDVATSLSIPPLWNLIRAKTVYQCLQPDIYWKWPLVKVIAKAWRGFLMSPWSFFIFWANKPHAGLLMEQYISHIIWETGALRGLNLQTLISIFAWTRANQQCRKLFRAWDCSEKKLSIRCACGRLSVYVRLCACLWVCSADNDW